MLKEYLDSVEFAYPQVLFLLLLIPVIAGWYISYAHKLKASLRVSSLKSFHNTSSIKSKLRHLPFVLRLMVLTLIITALARPRSHNDEKNVEGEGIDIVLCLDVSGSMLAQDFKPNRLVAAKRVALDFIRDRPTDRIGLVIFAGESFTQCPVTSDHATLETQLAQVEGGFLLDGTAIGSGLATSADRLQSSEAKSKVIILLTDGENNGGLIGPLPAMEIAKTLGIKVYTIGVGSDGYANTPILSSDGQVVMQQEKVNIDESLLQQIASETGGKYFRARSNESLRDIYGEIDEMEKTKINTTITRKYTERFHPLALIAIGLMLLELLLRTTVFRRFP